jgi:uncharacterized repeat protein (TIGR03803 family)
MSVPPLQTKSHNAIRVESMNPRLPNSGLLSFLLVGHTAIGVSQACGQSLTTLHSFTALSAPSYEGGTNVDGAFPNGGLKLSGNTLFGTVQYGGTSNGTVFKVNIDGTGFTTIHGFTASSGLAPHLINSDGLGPYACLVVSGKILYGTAPYGGPGGDGTVFGVNTDGTGFTNLHNFTETHVNRDGANPWAGLILSSNTLYGTTASGGRAGFGTVFAINMDGTGFTNLHSFMGNSGQYIEGLSPMTGLVLSSNRLYGTTENGGRYSGGTVFALNTDGTGFTNLHDFVGGDGQYPLAELLLSSNTLYGTTSHGGSSGNGTVFALNTDGTGFRDLYHFTPMTGPLTFQTNSDGAIPITSLVPWGPALYGTTHFGGSSGSGTVFALNMDGTGFTILYSFSKTSGSPETNGDGAFPQAGLLLSDGTLYGMAHGGGINGAGTLFTMSLVPQMTLVLSGPNLILSWPTNFSGYTLQSAARLNSPDWTTNLPGPVVVMGQYTITTPTSGAQQFYRLSQ